MTIGSITEEEMQYLIDKYKGDEIDKIFSTGLLSHPGNAAGPRQHMFSSIVRSSLRTKSHEVS